MLKIEKEILNTSTRRLPVNIEVIQNNNSLEVSYTDDKNNTVKELIKVQSSINRPTTKEEIKEKLTKLGSTPFKVNKINIDIKDNIFVNMKDLNEVRRLLIDNLIDIRTKINRNNNMNNYQLSYSQEKFKDFEISVLARTKEQIKASLDKKVYRIYVDRELYEQYKGNNNIYLRLPRVSNNYNNNTKHRQYTSYQ